MIRTLLVEDALIAAKCIDRLPGFEFVGQVRSGREALQWLATNHTDLVLLDIYLPDMSGLDLLRRLRGAADTVDVIAITRALDLPVVQAAVSLGVLQFLVKPFTFNLVRQRLERYQEYSERTANEHGIYVQQDVDDLLKRLRGTEHSGTPGKGISAECLQAVIAALRQCASGGMSAKEVAQILNASRVTARRYLECLVESGQALRRAHYQGAGRPKLEYTWRTANEPAYQTGETAR